MPRFFFQEYVHIFLKMLILLYILLYLSIYGFHIVNLLVLRRLPHGHAQISLSFSTDAAKKFFSKSQENAAICGVTMHFGC